MSPSNPRLPRIAYAGDRQLGVQVLDFLLAEGVQPLALLLPDPSRSSHSGELRARCPHLSAENIWIGDAFKSPEALAQFRALELDYIISIHFPHIYPPSVLEIPKEGVLNLHPAYLPFSRGWNTSAWAIIEKKPFGATLHFMSEKVDMGDIVHQVEIPIGPADTGDVLYKKGLAMEFEVFKQAWPKLVDRSYSRKPQPLEGTSHKRKDLVAVQEIRADEMVRAGDLIDRLRALTTNMPQEACYIAAGGKRYRLQLRITEEP